MSHLAHECPLHLATHTPTQHDNDATPSAFDGVKIIRTLTGVVQKTVTVTVSNYTHHNNYMGLPLTKVARCHLC